MKTLLALLLLSATAQAQSITYRHSCQDFDWPCVNQTQAASRAETRKQVRQAIRNTGYKGSVRIISVDPVRRGQVWTYGAYRKNGVLYFSAMAGCPNARWELEKLLRTKQE